MNFTLTFTADELRLLKKGVSEYDYQTFLKQEEFKKRGYNPLNPIDLSAYERFQSIQHDCGDLYTRISNILKEAGEL